MILSGKNKRVDVIGAGGHARSVIGLLERCEYGVEGVYDETYDPKIDELIAGVKLRGKFPEGNNQIVLAIGNGALREKMIAELAGKVLEQSVIDPSVIRVKDNVIGNYNLVMPGVIFNTDATIGNNNIINTGTVVDHEVQIGNNTHVSAMVMLCGRVKIGSYCFIGAGSTIIDRVSICDHVLIGAGTVVIKSITEPGTYVGNPARKIK